MSEDVECPYCETWLEINHDDGFGYEEGTKHQMECEHCGKTFVFETSLSFYYESEKADCLNDGEHVWKYSKTCPIEATHMFCTLCDERRLPTEKEWITIKGK